MPFLQVRDIVSYFTLSASIAQAALWCQVYYRLYAKHREMPSKSSLDLNEPALGRVVADSISPPTTPLSIKRHISRVEQIPELEYAALFADISSDTPMKDNCISLLSGDCPGLTKDRPMALVQLAQTRVVQGRVVDGGPHGEYTQRIVATTDYCGMKICPPQCVSNVCHLSTLLLRSILLLRTEMATA
jgi:hypothetical protein